MSGFLKRAVKGEDAESEGDGLEELYMQLFSKVGRDFVHKEDLQNLLSDLLLYLDPLGGLALNLSQDSEARKRAREYQELLDANKLGSDIYKDLIDLSDD